MPDPAKQALGLMMLGLSFVVLAIAQERAERFGTVGPQWLAGVYVLHTLGELMLSPIGLALVSKLAPARLASLLMGVWPLSSAAANYLSGTLEALLQGSGLPLYWFLVGSSMSAGLLMLAMTPWLTKLMHGRSCVAGPAGRGSRAVNCTGGGSGLARSSSLLWWPGSKTQIVLIAKGRNTIGQMPGTTDRISFFT